MNNPTFLILEAKFLNVNHNLFLPFITSIVILV